MEMVKEGRVKEELSGEVGYGASHINKYTPGESYDSWDLLCTCKECDWVKFICLGLLAG